MTEFNARLIALFAALLTATAQLLLKKGAGASHGRHALRLWVNPWMASGYGVFLLVVYLNTVAMRVLDYKWAVLLGSLTYLAVNLLARVFLRERLNRLQLAGMALILAGMLVFPL